MRSASSRPRREARTPAVQQIVAASRERGPSGLALGLSRTRPGSIASTIEPSCNLTPLELRYLAAVADNFGSMVGSTRSTASTRITWQASAWSCLKSRLTARCISSINEPASSQPAGPAPTTTAVCRKRRRIGSWVCSASSKAIKMRRRISSACSRIFIGGASSRQSSWPK